VVLTTDPGRYQYLSLMVVMAVVTTAMAGPLLNWLHPVRATDPGFLDLPSRQEVPPGR
jgi:hypothetical protein